MNAQETAVIQKALAILEAHINTRDVMQSPQVVEHFLRLKLAMQEREVFAVCFLDTKHRLIEYRELFFGTIDQAQVNPREIAKAALLVNAAAVILAHNHPSGDPEPSSADLSITQTIRTGLDFLDIRLLDHFVVGVNGAVSFAERGWL